MIGEYKDLLLWGYIRKLIKLVFFYDFSPPFENQIKRAVVSIGANVAEGIGSGGGYLKKYLMCAKGSAFEVEGLLILYHDLGFSNFNSIYEESLSLLKDIINGIAELRTIDAQNTIRKRIK